MKLPTLDQCFTLQEEYGMFSHIGEHCTLVSVVARNIGARLKDKGYYFLDLDLLETAGMLHDITKTHHIVAKGFYKQNKGEVKAQEFLKKYEHRLSGKSFEDIQEQWEEMQRTLGADYHQGHPETGRKLLEHLGYPELGNIVAQHNQPLTDISTASILCYADRIVGRKNERNVLVTIDERFEYVAKAYGQKWVDRLKEPTKILEQNILDVLK